MDSEKSEMDYLGNYRFVFICGLHRSGTSLIHKILRENPSISGFSNTGIYEDEGQHLQSVFKPASYFGGPGRFGNNKRSHKGHNHYLINEKNRQKLFNDWSRFWDMDKPILVEKSPINTVQTRFLQEIFPNSYFITIVRNPLVVSLATAKWTLNPIHRQIEHWLSCHKVLFDDLVFIRNHVEISYEDFVSQPDKGMSKISALLEEPISLNREVSNMNEKYRLLWESRRANWILSKLDRITIKKLNGRVKELGYDLTDFSKFPRYD